MRFYPAELLPRLSCWKYPALETVTAAYVGHRCSTSRRRMWASICRITSCARSFMPRTWNTRSTGARSAIDSSSTALVFLRQGPLTTGSAPVGAFCHTRDGLEAPDVQIHFASCGTLYNDAGKIRALKQPAVTAVVNQSRPRVTGFHSCQAARTRLDAPVITAERP